VSHIRVVVQAADKLGEGPVWSPRDGRLYWFDIKGSRLNWFAPAGADSGAFELPLRASAAVVREMGGLVLATEKGLAAIDVESGEFGMIEAFDLGDGFRSNDGKIDTEGRFWWSTMDDDGGKRPGAVYRTGPDWKTQKMLAGIHIPNTISFSPDGRTLYMADSKRQTLFAHEVADLSKVREFAHTRGEVGSPDGSAVDAEGYLWNAQWGAARIVRYAPDGRIDRILRTPVSQPTSCAFGGPDLKTLYITSAWEGLSAQERAAQPLAGALFAVEPGVAGCPLPMFKG
jgi:sugar lactone lactonase YvrE